MTRKDIKEAIEAYGRAGGKIVHLADEIIPIRPLVPQTDSELGGMQKRLVHRGNWEDLGVMIPDTMHLS